jgi:putative toxin-antitoxin system antitoxin component (TIGR02293 family)
MISDHMSKRPALAAATARPLREAVARAISSTLGRGTLPDEDAIREAAEDFTIAYRADAMERIELVKRGVPADFIQALAKRMSMPKERLAGTLGLASATVNRKSRSNKPLSRDESSRVLGMARLVGQVQAMVEESGSPDDFDAATWVAQWLDKPLPAIGGRRPAELMDTPEGQRLVSDLVARLQTGAYA